MYFSRIDGLAFLCVCISTTLAGGLMKAVLASEH